MAKKLKNLMILFFFNLLPKLAEDLFILAGVSVIVATTYIEFGSVVGNYLLGFIFLLIGFLIAKK